MTTDYNAANVAQQYKQAKEQPWRSRVETYSLLKRCGDMRGQRVVDAACGEGYFTRRLKQAGAAEVLGFDVSEKMVDLANSQEAADPLGINYRVADARVPVPQEAYDLVVSAWLLVYAHDRGELAEMARGVASWLRPGGRFVTYTTNPGVYDFTPRPDYRKYGFDVELEDRAYDGAPILWKLHLDDSTLEIENYYLPISSYKEAFEAAGFTNFQVHVPELSPSPTGEDDSAYWNDFLEYPIAVVVECEKT